jgi:2-oxoglutarate ferredoxin oxidoreductase subunit alpha
MTGAVKAGRGRRSPAKGRRSPKRQRGTEHFWNGDIACAEGAIAAGCRFFGGYPITPATEVAERIALRFRDVGGTFIQMEDELASMNAIIGASWGGAKSMTSTSGPGFSLMMENLGLGIMMETPCVVVNVQRGGPSTGLPTLVGQADVMQAKWGSHGDYEIIALAPSSPQEFFDLTIRAFNLAEKYRTPVIVLADEVVGHMSEKVIVPPPGEIEIIDRARPTVPPEEYRPYRFDGGSVWPMAIAGDGYRFHVTGLTHDERGYPAMNAEAQARLMEHLIAKIRDNVDDIIDIEEDHLRGAEVVVVSYGISARVAMGAVQKARKAGIRVGMIKMRTVWPFPEERIRRLSGRIRAFVVPEINMGQVALEVERCAGGRAKTIPVCHAGGHVHDPDLILKAIKRGAK